MKAVALYLAAALYILAGTFHFLSPAPYLKIMPPWIPWQPQMIFLSGMAEIAGGVGLLIPKLRRPAAWGLVALLIAVFPANLYMATNHIQMGAKPLPDWAAWARLPIQALLIWWVLWCTRTNSPKSPRY
jgi:uncharacterized membrane protein